MVDEGRLTAAAARTLSALEPGAYTQHKSWGFGRVSGWNLDGNQILIDFGPKKAHPMQLQYAGENLKVIPEEHPLARKSADLPSVKKQASEDPAALVGSILKHSDHRKATPVQIAALLMPGGLLGRGGVQALVGRGQEGAQEGRALRHPGQEDGVRRDARRGAQPEPECPGAVRHGAASSRTQLAVLDEISKNIEDFKADTDGLVDVLVEAGKIGGAQPAAGHRRRVRTARHPRRDRQQSPGVTLPDDAPLLTTMMRDEEDRLGEVIGNLPATKQRFALFQMPAALGEDKWAQRALSLLPQTHNARVVGEVARLFEAQKRTDEMRTFLDRAIRDYSA